MRLIWSLLFLTVPILGVGLLAMSYFTPGGWLPANISEAGPEIDRLFYYILGITGVIFVITEVLLVWAMWSSRGHSEGGKSHYSHGNTKLEIAWTLGTAAILLFIAFYQIPIWSAAKYYSQRPKGKVPDVLVEASQFLWQVRYPAWDAANNRLHALNTLSPDNALSFEQVNELHLPAGESILIHLKAKDVLHSFWIPAMRVKQDTVPGNLAPVWFKIDPKQLEKSCLVATPAQPVRVGDEVFTELYQYEWTCAELCGWGHSMMRARLIVHPNRADYERWLRAASKDWLNKTTAAAP
ncbi:MAG TPA: cytochrome c oxidase subunit II [Gemmatales bacterium]|nr:cytochrome c oxidase subunit II [Gemmatales bacterium]